MTTKRRSFFKIKFLVFVLVLGAFGISCATLDSGFQRQSTTTSINFDWIDQSIFLWAHFNGKGPYRLLLDSGASNLVLSQEVSNEIGLEREDSHRSTHFGETKVEVFSSHLKLLQIQDLWISNQQIFLTPLQSIAKDIGVERIDGILGGDIFRRFIVGINFEKKQIAFTDPKHFTYSGKGQEFLVRRTRSSPEIEISVDGKYGHFGIDTGDRWSITLFKAFADKQGFREKFVKNTEAVAGWGIGGPLFSKQFRVNTVRVGDFELSSLKARVPTASVGSASRTDRDGNLGLGFLRRFNLIFNLPASKLILEKSSNFNHIEDFDRSGMWLQAHSEGFKVVSVIPNSPAAEAGRKGTFFCLSMGKRKQNFLSPKLAQF